MASRSPSWYAARLLARSIAGDIEAGEGHATDGRMEVVVIVRQCAAPSVPTTPQPISTDSRLSDTDRIVFGALGAAWKKARVIAADAGFAPKTASVRVSLAKLVRLGLAINQRGRGYKKHVVP